MDIFKHLDKSNCRRCGEKTCLAFAGEVFLRRQSIRACPKLNEKTIQRLNPGGKIQDVPKPEGEEYLLRLQGAVVNLDLSEAAQRSGGRFSNGRLTLKVMGKPFSIDGNGNFHGDIHVNPWIAVPFLNYVLYGAGLPVSGNWVSFRELEGGRERYALFQKRCERAMKRVADTFTGLFDDLVHIFDGKAVASQFQSDISVVLYPLPKIPLMICYWIPEENFESSLNLYLDGTAGKNLDIGSLFTLCVGLARMFKKLALRHGFRQEMSDRAYKD